MGKMFKVGSSKPPEYDIGPGTYEVVLVNVVEKLITSQYGQDKPMWEWQFEIPLDDGGVIPVNGLTSQIVTGGTASKKQSTAYGYLTALKGPLQDDDEFDPVDVIGLHAMAKVDFDKNGWLKVFELLAMPRRPAAAASNGGRPSQARQTVRAAAGESEDDLPF